MPTSSLEEVQSLVRRIEKKSRGKNTRILVLKAALKLGRGFHKGEEIRNKYKEMFAAHFDYLYVETLVFSYGILEVDRRISHAEFARRAKNAYFKIKDEYFEPLRTLLDTSYA